MAPFDKYTMGYAIQLKIIPDNKISNNNYVRYSENILDYIKKSDNLMNIVDFVREADLNTQWPIEPE